MAKQDYIKNLFKDKCPKNSDEYLSAYENEIIPESEKIFVRDFLFPILGKENMSFVIPQYPFIDSEGHCRRIDFALVKGEIKIAFEVNGETYHEEGIIPKDQFDDNLFRQNEILFHNWVLRRYSYNQLLAQEWRERVFAEIKLTLKKYGPVFLPETRIEPNALQKEVLPQLKSKRDLGWKKGLCIMPVGTGKTYTAALDSYDYLLENEGFGKTLFIVHKLGILQQSYNAFHDVWKGSKFGLLTGTEKTNVKSCDILFASKDSLCVDETLHSFDPDYFDYIIVDEVHHGEAPTYRKIIDYFTPQFLLGMTATPDRTDRKDILALFDYKKVCEYDLNDAISKGFLVAYEYHGLTDNIDYSKIRHNGKKYNVTDLERALIIAKRNQAIFDAYMKYCNGNKAIGFCVSIRHAKAMADFFNEKGINSVAITSSPEEDSTAADLIEKFKNNEFAVAFTVDMFNEGIDVPNVQALLFLRPTESKTIFVQQLGRGLRLNSNKDKVVVLDFISNYKRANQVRQYLATKSKEKTNDTTKAFEKVIYEYNPKCKVEFDDEVQQILDLQDNENHDVNEDDLVANYFDVKTELNRKPNPNDLADHGKYRIGKYVKVFGSWVQFLKTIGEITEDGYHYPQGLHFGHLCYILEIINSKQVNDSNIAPKYVRLRGDLDKGNDLSTFQRQTKYKIQGLMGMKLLVDDRKSLEPLNALELSENGCKLYNLLKPVIKKMNFAFKTKDKGYSWDMEEEPEKFVKMIKSFLFANKDKLTNYIEIMLEFDAVRQAINFIYKDARAETITKKIFYENLFETQEVINYCEYNGIGIPSLEGRNHRAPFIVSILETMGIVSCTRSEIHVNKMLLFNFMFGNDVTNEDIEKCKKAIIERDESILDASLVEICKELFGKDIFEYDYWINNIEDGGK